MPFYIRDAEADRLVRELAAVTGESLTEAARNAFADRLERVTREKSGPAERRDRIRRIVERVRALPERDARNADEILDYDDQGLPR